jgi:hypothetical protein
MSEQTIGDWFAEALKCETKEAAQEWFAAQVKQHVELYGQAPDEAECILRSNLGYMAGYYDQATSQKVYDLFGAAHPIFGGPGYWGTVTPDEALAAGKRLADGDAS